MSRRTQIPVNSSVNSPVTEAAALYLSTDSDDDVMFSSPLLGNSPRMRSIRGALRQIASASSPVLISGEGGCGKTALARAIHLLSPRSDKRLIKVNCAALSSQQLERELFGWEHLSKLEAPRQEPGKLDAAQGGMLLLRAIDEIDLRTQARLLEFVQEAKFYRSGGREPVFADVRLISTCRGDLEDAARENHFRADLYYHVSALHVAIPPLRERHEDLIPLAEFFLHKHSPKGQVLVLPSTLSDAMQRYWWPGNLRELESTILRYLTLRDPERIADELIGTKSVPLASSPIVRT